MLRYEMINCPYCGETFGTHVDCSGGSQAYVEDCQVCCRPILFDIELDDQGDVSSIIVKRDDD